MVVARLHGCGRDQRFSGCSHSNWLFHNALGVILQSLLLVVTTQLIVHVLLRFLPASLLLVRLGLDGGPVGMQLRQLLIHLALPLKLVVLRFLLSPENTVPYRRYIID